MSGEIALDTSAAVRFLNGDATITEKVLALPEVPLPMVMVRELLFGAENSTRPLQNQHVRYRTCALSGIYNGL